jgi:hypothetical protein
MNQFYKSYFFERDLQQYSPEILELWKQQKHADIIYFGESSNMTVRDTDVVKKNISEIVNDLLHDTRVAAVNKPATHAGIYKEWIKNMCPNQTKAIIVTLNLRSFDADWRYSELESALQSGVVLIKPYPALMNRFLLALNSFDHKTPEIRNKERLHEWETLRFDFPFEVPYSTVRQWDDAMANGGYLKPDGSWDLEKIELACHYIKSYAFQITPENPRVQDFDEIVAYCQKNNIKLYLNLLAENTEYARNLVGPVLVQIMRYNRDFLLNRYGSKKGVTVVDNLELLNGLDFSDQNWTTEHYGYDGRLKIAKNLAKAIILTKNAQTIDSLPLLD